MQINVLYQFNDKYAVYAGVSITSLLENNKQAEEINVYILGEELLEDSIQKLKLLAKKYNRNIIFKETKEIIEKMKIWGLPSYRGAYSANLRLFLPLILDETEKSMRILYLDADTIVNQSVNMLFDMDMQGYAIAMALDSLGEKYKRKIGLKKNEKYYNSGVILFEMGNWIKYRCTERIISHIKIVDSRYTSPDQDLLNIVCKNEIMCLQANFNLQPIHLAFRIKDYYKCYGEMGYYEEKMLKEAINDVVIYHCFRFLGEFPWHLGNIHPNNKLFDKYLLLSPWKEYVKKKANVDFSIKIEKILFKILPKGVFLYIFTFFHNIYVGKGREIA